MADDRSEAGPRDANRVNVHEDYEVDYWTKKWGISKQQLVAAVDAVGTYADDIARYIQKKS